MFKYISKTMCILLILIVPACDLPPEQREFAQNLAAASCHLTMRGCAGSTTNRNNKSRLGTGFYQYDYTKGFNKVCVYDRLGSVDTLVIRNTGICPMTIN